MKIMTENYLDLTIEEVYDVITKINVWPIHFDNSKKVAFMNSMIKYFIEKEEYEKCAKLQRFIDDMENREQSDRRSRTISD